ncbi:pilus assembly FimT family protein [Argonema galeatum]|uniref:pilus assembly FimT family protein n=1 Tax=Argonema galeatum TaxID=2942762 RepID=UPI0023DF30D4|nr:type II secretion system protein [Argonema galeatum]MCL1464472.1 type II secretion system GspH family protein [Argonema galeatum A003/A1]
MQYQYSRFSRGYTLVEMLVVIALIGIISAIAVPGWLAFLNRIRLNSSQAQALSVMREAQVNAKREKRIWEASFRNSNGLVQWSTHPDSLPPESWNWQNLIGEDADNIEIDVSKTTLLRRDGAYNVQFQYKGHVNGQLGRITFIIRAQSNSANASKRCVWVSTLLGVLRTDGDRGCQGN